MTIFFPRRLALRSPREDPLRVALVRSERLSPYCGNQSTHEKFWGLARDSFDGRLTWRNVLGLQVASSTFFGMVGERRVKAMPKRRCRRHDCWSQSNWRWYQHMKALSSHTSLLFHANQWQKIYSMSSCEEKQAFPPSYMSWTWARFAGLFLTTCTDEGVDAMATIAKQQ